MESIKQLLGAAAARLKLPAVMASNRLPPPGQPIDLADTERHQRTVLLDLAKQYGPIFSVSDSEGPVVCIVGMPLSKRFLTEHSAALQPVTLDLKSLFAEGFMRQMEGETHQQYRKSLLDAITSLRLESYSEDFSALAETELAAFAGGHVDGDDRARDYLASLTRIATGMLIRLFFGVRPGSSEFDQIAALYNQLGPHGLVWNLKEQQITAFNDLCQYLLGDSFPKADVNHPDAPQSIFHNMMKQGSVNETSLGNLIYMVEMGRYDTKGLFRWISFYASQKPELLNEIARSVAVEPKEVEITVRAFVKETLRMDQSERLMRNVKSDIVFEGFTIPQGWRARVCMWEAHKDEEHFNRPFDFDPNRFIASRPTPEQYSPFGLDQHQCPFSGISMAMGSAFLTGLAGGYSVEALNTGPSVRGGYHWEPAINFSVVLSPRETLDDNPQIDSSGG